ncbi:MAG: DUF3368 domain-containing protein [bacterium]
MSVVKIKNNAVVASLRTQIDAGESEAIALAMEVKECILILDDKKARRIAKQLELKVIGTIGLILRAKKSGVVSEVKPLLNELQTEGFRIRNPLYQKAVRLAKEK